MRRLGVELGGLIAAVLMTVAFTPSDAFASSSRQFSRNIQAKELAVIKDEYSYLEEVHGVAAMGWVREQNARTLAELQGDRRYPRHLQTTLDLEQRASAEGEISLQRGRLWLHQGWVYEVAVESARPQGLWRRAPLESVLDRRPKWQTLIDVDALGAAENKNWWFAGMRVAPNGRRCLIQLLLNASGVTTWREYDLEERSFVAGFELPPAPDSSAAWWSDDAVVVSTNFGHGSMSSSGMPLVAKLWLRGQPLSSAREVVRGQPDDTMLYVLADGMNGGVQEGPQGRRIVHVTSWDKHGDLQTWRLNPDGKVESLKLDPLKRAEPVLYKDQYVIALQSDWQVGGKTWRRGSVIAVPVADRSLPNPPVYPVLIPEEDSAVLRIVKTASGLLLDGSHLGTGRLWRVRLNDDGSWSEDIVPFAGLGVPSPEASDIHSDTALVRYEGVLHPSAIYSVSMQRREPELVSVPKDKVEDDAFVTEQKEARSADGMMVPYSLVRPRVAAFPGQAPVLIVGYGSRGASYLPSYSAPLVKLWLEKGGVYVIAHVRGGQERGSHWRVEGVERQHTYDDVVAVAEELIRRQLTVPKRIGFMGYSAGGLPGGVMLTHYPNLFGAVVLKAPVLDLFRLDLIGGGPQAWEREFGSTANPAERAFFERTSPFQSLRSGARLPKPLLIASATDDMVCPGQPRRFAAKMQALKLPFLYYETTDGGHAVATAPADRAHLEALIYTYLTRQLFPET